MLSQLSRLTTNLTPDNAPTTVAIGILCLIAFWAVGAMRGI